MNQVQSHPGKTNGFHWMDADAYLFDIDGTLLSSRDHVHYDALNRALQEVYGVDTTIAGVAYHGKTDLGILRAALERVGVSGGVFEERLSEALTVPRGDEQCSGNLSESLPGDSCPDRTVASCRKTARAGVGKSRRSRLAQSKSGRTWRLFSLWLLQRPTRAQS
jgi:hypothetical protein